MQERKQRMKRRKGVVSMDEDNMSVRDQINAYLFTMSDDELMDVLRLIEDYISGQNEG